MQSCPECGREALRMMTPKPGEHDYLCDDCGHSFSTVEVPERYLRELVLNSIKLASMVKLPGA